MTFVWVMFARYSSFLIQFNIKSSMKIILADLFKIILISPRTSNKKKIWIEGICEYSYMKSIRNIDFDNLCSLSDVSDSVEIIITLELLLAATVLTIKYFHKCSHGL